MIPSFYDAILRDFMTPTVAVFALRGLERDYVTDLGNFANVLSSLNREQNLYSLHALLPNT